MVPNVLKIIYNSCTMIRISFQWKKYYAYNATKQNIFIENIFWGIIDMKPATDLTNVQCIQCHACCKEKGYVRLTTQDTLAWMYCHLPILLPD